MTEPTGGSFLIGDTPLEAVFTPEDLSEEARLLAETTVRFMEEQVLPHTEELERQEEGLARRLFTQAGQLGLLGLEVPEAYGGLGLSKTTSIGVAQQFSRNGGFGVTCGAHSGIGSEPLTYFGTEAQKQKYLPKLASGEWMAAYALSEAGSGSDAMGLKTKATRSEDGSHYILNGTKMWISNAGWADLFTIFTKVDNEHVTAFLVERTFPGVSTGKEEHKLGIKSSSTRRVILDNVRVPAENILGEVGKGPYIAFNILNLGRLNLGAGALGGAKQSLGGAIRYAKEREQFGRPIASFGLIQHKLAESAARIYAGESALYRTAGMIDAIAATGRMVNTTNPPFPLSIDEFAIECSLLKVAGSEILSYVTDEALQIHGGYGYTEEFPTARAYRDARINRVFEGTNEINRLFVPGMLLRRAQRGRLPLLQAITQATKSVIEFSPFQQTSADELETTEAALRSSKQLALLLAGVAHQRFGEALQDQQEILAALSDILSDIYLAESAYLRLRKTGANETGIRRECVLVYVNDAMSRIEQNARQIVASSTEGDDQRAQLGFVKRLTRWQPLDTVALRRKIAAFLLERGVYAVA
jgi:alkylation response protein AidB-like acyl-CoA dehydrogenase